MLQFTPAYFFFDEPNLAKKNAKTRPKCRYTQLLTRSPSFKGETSCKPNLKIDQPIHSFCVVNPKLSIRCHGA